MLFLVLGVLCVAVAIPSSWYFRYATVAAVASSVASSVGYLGCTILFADGELSPFAFILFVEVLVGATLFCTLTVVAHRFATNIIALRQP